MTHRRDPSREGSFSTTNKEKIGTQPYHEFLTIPKSFIKITHANGKIIGYTHQNKVNESAILSDGNVSLWSA